MGDLLSRISSCEEFPPTVGNVSEQTPLARRLATHSKNVCPWYVSCRAHRNCDPSGLRSKALSDCRFPSLGASSVFKLDPQRSELRLCDQDAKKDGRIEVGEALAAGGRTAVANKQARNRILSRVVVVVSRQKKSERRVSIALYKPASNHAAQLHTDASCHS